MSKIDHYRKAAKDAKEFLTRRASDPMKGGKILNRSHTKPGTKKYKNKNRIPDFLRGSVAPVPGGYACEASVQGIV